MKAAYKRWEGACHQHRWLYENIGVTAWGGGAPHPQVRRHLEFWVPVRTQPERYTRRTEFCSQLG